jgi:c(7)-type cytochrome triheme protein
MTMDRGGDRLHSASTAAPVRLRAAARWLVATLAALACVAALAAAQKWLTVAKDGLHDPASPAIGVLQEPAEALGALGAQAPDAVGNQVRWVQALDRGLIQPRTNILPETKVDLRTTEILLKNTGEMPMVRFPHRAHTAWLDCSNCHDTLFNRKPGTSGINMLLILAGEKCGLCHGAVAFPLTECNRCHSVHRGSPEHQAFGALLVRESSP